MININYLGNIDYKQNNGNSDNKVFIENGKYDCILEDIDIKDIPIEWNKMQKHQLVLKFKILNNSNNRIDKRYSDQCFYINHHIPYGQNDPDFDKLIKPLQITCSYINSNYDKLEDFLNSDLSQNTNSIYQIEITNKNNYVTKYIKKKLGDATIHPKPITPPDPFSSDGNVNYDPFTEDV